MRACSHTVEKLTLKEAKNLGKDPCGYWLQGTSTVDGRLLLLARFGLIKKRTCATGLQNQARVYLIDGPFWRRDGDIKQMIKAFLLEV
jgi:hypothetical protein